MTIRTLFNIILKVLGILLLQDIFAMVPQILSIFLYLTKADTVTEAIWTLASSLAIFSVYCLASYWLIFKSNFLIDKLNLDKGFDQDTIPLNTHRSTILSIAIIVIGGLILVDEIPNLCRQLFSYYQEKRMTQGMTNPTLSYSIVAGVKIVIGLFLVVGQRQIVNLIERQRKK